MAIAVVLEFAAAGLAPYDQVIEKMHLAPRGPGAPGGMFHWATVTDDGLRATDDWQSREQFDAFAKEQIGPITAEVGIPSPPKITSYEVHNYLTAGP